MRDSTVKPNEINLHKGDGYLEVKWRDGVVCRYPLANLREACPCAECRGGHDKMGAAHDPEDILKVTIRLTPARSYEIDTILPVGNYALQPVWADGHNSGIYTWEYLRHLCTDEDLQRSDEQKAADE